MKWLIERIRQQTPKIFPEPEPNDFTADDALERFVMLAGAGADGQNPVATYGDGTEVILNNFPPGTLLRETTVIKVPDQDLVGAEYVWWCVGNFHQQEGVLHLYDAYSVIMDEAVSGPVLLLAEDMMACERRIAADRKGVVAKEIKDVDGRGTFFDMHLASQVEYARREDLQRLPDIRHTVEVDVMDMGTPVRSLEPRDVRRLGRLRLAPDGEKSF